MTNDEKLAQILEESVHIDCLGQPRPRRVSDWAETAPEADSVGLLRDDINAVYAQRYGRIRRTPTGREQATVLPLVPAAADIDDDKSLEQLEPEVRQARAFLNTPEARVLRALYLAGVLPADVYVKAIQIVGGMR